MFFFIPFHTSKIEMNRSRNTPNPVSRLVVTEYTVSCKMPDCS